jgi:DNA mismatch endonuclease (patch repair protein)
MASVKQRNTVPEVSLRKALHEAGFRFRLHPRSLPGHPDIVLPRYRLAIFVHGCFWHRHHGCKKASTPKTNLEYWIPKFHANVERDARKAEQIESLGWRVFIAWQCEIEENVSKVVDQIAKLVGNNEDWD